MPACTETKFLLSGYVHTYSCELLHYIPGFGILRYVIDREYRVGPVVLRPGCVTYALYWESRPYTLYTWHMPGEAAVIYYFNIADRILLAPAEFKWRDLVIDVLVDADKRTHVLDREELPAELSPALDAYIRNAVDHIMANSDAIIREADGLVRGFI
jgi:hypothetical protein